MDGQSDFLAFVTSRIDCFFQRGGAKGGKRPRCHGFLEDLFQDSDSLHSLELESIAPISEDPEIRTPRVGGGGGPLPMIVAGRFNNYVLMGLSPLGPPEFIAGHPVDGGGRTERHRPLGSITPPDLEQALCKLTWIPRIDWRFRPFSKYQPNGVWGTC